MYHLIHIITVWRLINNPYSYQRYFGYYFLGEDQVLLKVSVQDTLTSIFDDPKEGRGPLAYMAVICFGIHMIGCCVIKSIILTRSTQLLLNPKGSNKATWISRLQWAGISFVVLVLAWSLTLIM